MRLTRLTIQNVMRITAVEIEPDGSMVIIAGNNGQGKTSCLDSLEMLLCGLDSMPDEPLKRGASSGFIRGEFAEVHDLGNIVVTRTILPNGGGSLKIEAKVGENGLASIASPQKWLNERIERRSFDPMGFIRMDPKQQAETYRKLTGVDTRPLELERKRVYDDRTLVNRQARDAQGVVATMPVYPDAPAEPVSVADLRQKLAQAQVVNKARDKARTEADRAADSVKAACEALSTREADVAKLREMLSQVEEKVAMATSAVASSVSTHGRLVSEFEALPTADESAILDEMGRLDAINREVSANQERARAAARVTELDAKSQALTDQLAKLDADKAKMLQEARCPVKGLGLNEDGIVTFRDLPLSQASSAEATRVTMALGLAMHPELKVVLIRDGSLLDDKSLGLVADMAKKAGAQVWIERVGSGDAGAVVIEDGCVRAEVPQVSVASDADDESPFKD